MIKVKTRKCKICKRSKNLGPINWSITIPMTCFHCENVGPQLPYYACEKCHRKLWYEHFNETHASVELV